MNAIQRKVNFEQSMKKSHNLKYSSLVGLMLHEQGEEVLQMYKNQNGSSIFKLICDCTDNSNASEMIELYESLLKIATDFGSSEIVNLHDFNVDELLKLKNSETKSEMLWCLVRYWKVNGSNNHEELKTKLMAFPNVKALIFAKQDRFKEFEVAFNELILGLLVKSKKELNNKKLLKMCITIAIISTINFNLEFINYLIFNKDINYCLRLPIVMIACQAGFYETIKMFFDQEFENITENFVKRMMISVMNGIVLRKESKSFLEIFNPVVNYDMCFDIIYSRKKDMADKFLSLALEVKYEEIILLILKTGYFIGRKGYAKALFLTERINEELFRKILDNCVTLEQHNKKKNLKVLKVDFRIFFNDKKRGNVDKVKPPEAQNLLQEVTVTELSPQVENPAINQNRHTNEPALKWLKPDVINWTLLIFYWFLVIAYLLNGSDVWAILTLILPFCILLRTIYYVFKDERNYLRLESIFDLFSITCGILYGMAIIMENKDLFNITFPTLIILSLVEVLLLIEAKVKIESEDECLRNPLQLIADSEKVKNAIDHPVLITYLEIMDKKFARYNKYNFYIFVIFWAMLLISIEISLYFNYFAFYLYVPCISFVGVRESIQLILFGKLYFRSVVNWIEFSIVLSGIVGFCDGFREDKTIFHVSTAILIIITVLELILLWSKIWKYILITMSMFLRVTIMYGKLITIFSLVLIGFSLSFILIFSPTIQEGFSEMQNATNDSLKKKDEVKDKDTDLNEFKSNQMTFLKVLIMLTGEFDASNIEIKNLPRFIFFMVFVFVAVAVFNFMNALAIEEVDGLKKGAEYFILKEKLKTICNYECHLPLMKVHLMCLEKFFLKFSNDIEGMTEIFINVADKSVKTNENNSKILSIDQSLCDNLLALTYDKYETYNISINNGDICQIENDLNYD